MDTAGNALSAPLRTPSEGGNGAEPGVTHAAEHGAEQRGRDAVEAAAFRRLTALLRRRTDVQNVDLMAVGGFCRNCLSDWVAEAAADHGIDVSKDAAREMVYGMPYADYKARHQTPATPEQLAAMAASVAKNRAERPGGGVG